MSIGKPTDPVVRSEIIEQIRHNGLKVSDAATRFGVSTKTIYNWLRAGVVDGNRNLILENNRLKRELEMTYRLLGRATAELKRPKG